MKAKILPSVVLCLICAIVCGLLVGAYELTYVDNTGVMTDELIKGCNSINKDSEYEILKDENGNVVELEGIVATMVPTSDSKTVIFEIKEKGYSKDGIHILVGVNEDLTVAGIYYISCGETAGVGTKTQDDDYLAKYDGVKSDEIDDIDNITGATYSSKGFKKAVKHAIECYEQNKEAIFSE